MRGSSLAPGASVSVPQQALSPASAPGVRKRRQLLCGVAGAVVLVMGCSDPLAPRFKSTDITGSTIGGDFTLTDFNGKERDLREFRGKVVILFFGFTQCPDVCPTALSQLAETMRLLGSKAKDVQVLFVTVDPERDSADVLAQYVPAFYPSFLGLRGDRDALNRVTKLFKVHYAKSATPGGGYSMDHTASKFVMDKQGRSRLLVPHQIGPAALAHDVEQLLK